MSVRLKVLFFCFIVFAVLIVGKAVHVQKFGDERLEKLAKRRFRSSVVLTPRRGLILDRNGSPLAVNQDTWSLAAHPKELKDQPKFAEAIRKTLKMRKRTFLKKLRSERGFVWIKRHLKPERKNQIKALLPDAEAGSLWLVQESRRTYPNGRIAAQLIGSVDVDLEGIEGIELWKNRELAGQGNRLKSVRDALGRSAFIDAGSAEKIKDGKSVYLTVDGSLQFEVEQALQKAVERYRADSGIVVVMNAVSGEVLSLANIPSFNLNQRKVPTSYRRNRAFTDGFEPGSTMKPLLLAAALMNGFEMNKKIHGGLGSFRLQGRTIREAESHEKFGWIDLKEMIRVSSNVVAAKLALELGPNAYFSSLTQLGFGSKTDSGFPGEIRGRVPGPEKMSRLRLANMGFGQGLLVTPIQLVRSYAALLNGGWLVQPVLVRADQFRQNRRPTQVVTKKTTEQLLEGLAQAVASGTGSKAQVDGYRIAGKTGTAQKIDPKTRRYSRKDYVASFIGFALEVDPKIVIFTMLDRPKTKYYAAETAVPLFKEVFRSVARRLGLPEQERFRHRDEVDEGTLAQRETDRLKMSRAAPRRRSEVEIKKNHRLKWRSISPEGIQSWSMPSLKGHSSRQVLRVFEGHDFYLKMSGFGVVSAQKPRPGAEISDGAEIEVQLSSP